MLGSLHRVSPVPVSAKETTYLLIRILQLDAQLEALGDKLDEDLVLVLLTLR